MWQGTVPVPMADTDPRNFYGPDPPKKIAKPLKFNPKEIFNLFMKLVA